MVYRHRNYALFPHLWPSYISPSALVHHAPSTSPHRRRCARPSRASCPVSSTFNKCIHTIKRPWRTVLPTGNRVRYCTAVHLYYSCTVHLYYSS
jgi:hypothetical protein